MKVVRLINKTKNHVLIERLKIADGFLSRGIGLLGRSSLPSGEGLYIKAGWIPCNSIHTFFMKFAIDCVFIDKNGLVVSILSKLPPWRATAPQWGAISVIELPAGNAHELNIEVGDLLYVGS